MIPQGKGMYLWQIKRVAGGDPNRIARMSANARLTHVLIKVADGKYSYNITDGVDKVPATVAALRTYGIQPWGWQYVYGSDPVAEAKKAIERVKQFNLPGFVVNAEGQFKAQGMYKAAKAYMKELRKGLPNLPIALSTYKYPTLHKDFPFLAFLDYCNFSMPQVYWIELTNPAEQLVRSVSEYRSLKPNQPIVPTGSAFWLGDWSATAQQVTEFLNKARQMNLPGANFWEMATSIERGELWRTIRDYKWGTSDALETVGSAGDQPEILTRYLDALNTGDPSKPTVLYEKNVSTHTYDGETRQGRTAIYAWYYNFLKKLLPAGRFKVTSYSQNGNTVKFSWAANSTAGSVRGGKDTIVLSSENSRQINKHTTEFTIGDPKAMDSDAMEEERPKDGPIPV